jgi:hypothetical protein
MRAIKSLSRFEAALVYKQYFFHLRFHFDKLFVFYKQKDRGVCFFIAIKNDTAVLLLAKYKQLKVDRSVVNDRDMQVVIKKD